MQMAGVVGADHQHGDFGLDIGQVAMLQSPDHVLGSVAAETQVDRLAIGVELLPDFLAHCLPSLG